MDALQKSHKSKSTASLLNILSRQDLVTKREVFEEGGLISHCEALWKKIDILSSCLTSYTSSIIPSREKSLLQSSQLQTLIAAVPPHLFLL